MSPSNETCHKERAEDGPPLFQNGNVVFQAYHVGWILAGFLAITATAASIWLVNKHLQWYTNKREQRYIVRILFMVPIYALVSFASFLFWNHSTALILIRDGYESTVLTAFFYLLLMYLSHDSEEQRSIFLKVGLSREADREARKKGAELKKWVFPLGFIKWKPQDGLYFLQLMKWGVLQYCVIRPTTTLAAVILDYMGLYCEESWGLEWGHIYITIVISISVTIAMYCLIQLYVPVAENLAPHRPLLKLFAIKAVVFLTFWQATFLSVLSMFGVVKDTKYMTAADVNIGIGAILETFEMMIFAFLHFRAFTYKPYQPFHSPDSQGSEPERTRRLGALGHAMDFRETFREIWVGWIYIWDKIRGREPTPDLGARRIAHYEEAFGRSRTLHLKGARKTSEKPSATLPAVQIGIEEDIDVDIEGERQWLGVGDDYGYGLGYIRRERSDSLGIQIDRELNKRGYTTHIPGRGHIGPPPDASPGNDTRRQPSWWRQIYRRFSEHGSGQEDEQGASLMANRTKRRSWRHSKGTENAAQDFLAKYEPDIDDPPPLSMIQQHHSRRNNRRPTANDDVLAPLPIFKDSRIPRQWAPPKIEVPNLSGTSIDNLSLDRGAHTTNSPPAVSSYADSLLGRIFPCPVESQGTTQEFIAGASVGSPSNTSMDEKGCARLSRATQHMLGQYYEFGVHPGDASPQTQYEFQVAPGPLTVEMIDPTHSLQSKPSHSPHRRESAHHYSHVTPSSSQPAPVAARRRNEEFPKTRDLDTRETPLHSADYNWSRASDTSHHPLTALSVPKHIYTRPVGLVNESSGQSSRHRFSVARRGPVDGPSK